MGGWHSRASTSSKNLMAATSILQQHRTSTLFMDYERSLAGGTKPNIAKVTLARKIAATVLAMWRKKEAYDSEKRKSKITELVPAERSERAT